MDMDQDGAQISSEGGLSNENTGVRYVDVVLQQGAEADEALRRLEQHGENAAVEYLALWDLGSETDTSAEAYGRVHDEVPSVSGDRIYATDTYVLNYNFSLGHIGLVRKVAGHQHDQGEAGTGASETKVSDRKLYDFPEHERHRYDVEGPDRNGVMDAFGHVHSDADPGL